VTHNPADDIPQAERRRIMADDRRAKATYHNFAQADADTELGGRYAKVQPTSVTGANPGSVYPKQPEGSPWRTDECPPEPPLGCNIDAVEPVGEVFEIEASKEEQSVEKD